MKKLLVILSIFEVLLLFACSQIPITLGAAQATPSPTSNDPVANHKIAGWSFEPEEKNDGKISLTISDVSETCHSLGQPIQIRMTFHNLTDKVLVIPGIFKIFTNSVGAADIIARIKPVGKDEIYPVIESSHAAIMASFPTPSAYYELPGNGTFEKIVEYHIRSEILVYDSQKDTDYFLPIGPGHYFLKFGYSLWKLDDMGRSKGEFGFSISNRIEICLK